jgi:tight adherence protein B
VTAVVFGLLAAATAATIEALRRAPSARAHAAVIAVAACGIAAVALAIGLGLPVALAGALLAVAGVVATRRADGARESARQARQIPGVAEHLADALGAGMSLPAALESAAEVTPAPLGGELRRATRRIGGGERVQVALEGLRSRVPNPAMDALVGAIMVQRLSGGDLSGALHDLSERLDEREQLAREVRGATAQARMTGGLVACLPLAAGLGLEVAQPGLLARILAGPGLGLVALSLLIQGLGMLLIRRLARVDL